MTLESLILFRETAIIFAIYGIYVLSLNLEVGYMGLPQFGKVMFLALGGLAAGGIAAKLVFAIYLSAIESKVGINPFADLGTYCTAYQYQVVGVVNGLFLNSPIEALAFFFMTLTIAALVGAAFGILMAGPAIKLRADYLGIFLLVSAEAIRVITTYTPQIACGVFGAVIPDPFVWMREWRSWGYLAVVLLFLLLTYIIIDRLGNSPFGRTLRAIRDAEVAAVVFGKDIVKFRVKVLATASALGGVAGALLAFYNNFVNMGQFVPLYTFYGWAMLIIGGVGNNAGALLGVGVYYAVDRLLSLNKEAIRAVVAVDPIFFQYITFGVILILVLMFRPEGLLAERPTKTLDKHTLRRLEEKT